MAASGLDLAAEQRRGAARGTGRASAALAIYVADPAGTQISNVLVTLEGATERSARTEAGRIAFEGLPPGLYRLRFEHEGFVTLERELNARAGAPIDVKVTLRPAPPPPPPPQPERAPEPPPSQVDAKPATFDVPSVIEKEWIGRGPGKTTPLACGSEGSATLIQVKEPVAQHQHDADEFIYIIAGEGNVNVAGRDQRVKAGVLVFMPRGTSHALTASGRNPLVVMSTKAGLGCADSR
jgi:mannose-6-phosphate isomerase-like protein (cupin superfamily)